MLLDRLEFKSRDPGTKVYRRSKQRRTTADRVRDAVLSLASNAAIALAHRETPWTSITFSGTRHELVLAFEDIGPIESGERFIAALPEHEFSIPGQLVADATITKTEHNFLPEPRLVVTAVLLLLDECV